VRLDDLLWDDWNTEHIARHNLTAQEVEEAVFDPSARFLRTRSGEGGRRYLVLGLTDAGRYLAVVLEPVGNRTAYVVTARNMTDTEQRRFKDR
jgi:uncharacterized protein